MSYNEIPNILVDSVVLPNKPVSNLEIIDAAKKLSLCGFRGVFLETLLLKNQTYGLCDSKKVRISSILIVMECNPLAS